MAAKCPECKKGAPAFMTTYGDMVTLLLTFFVMLFTVAKIDGREFKLVLSAFRGSLGMFEGGQTLSKGRLEEMGMNLESLPAETKGSNLAKAIKIATEVFKPEQKTKKVKLTQIERGLVISLVGNDNFAPGSARLTENTRRTLQKVARVLRIRSDFIRIEGHADETAVSPGFIDETDGKYETNWELASQRAINVLRYLHESEDVEPEKMSAVSFGKYRPLSDSKTPQGMAINRRVDIFILTGKEYQRGFNDPYLPGKKVPSTEWR